MADRNILAIHDRIDEEHFEVHLLREAVRSLQQRVVALEGQVRELRRAALDSLEQEHVQQSNYRRPARDTGT